MPFPDENTSVSTNYATRRHPVSADPVASNASALEGVANALEAIRVNHGHTLHSEVLAGLQSAVVSLCGMLGIPVAPVPQDQPAAPIMVSPPPPDRAA